jgi:hypothetical protein
VRSDVIPCSHHEQQPGRASSGSSWSVCMLMALMIFRPQGIFGDKKELALDAR